MTQALEFLAVLSAALFAGAALYINVVEHPARMGLETKLAAAQWAPSYKRATWLQAPLAILSFICGIAIWLLGAGLAWLVAALLIGAVVPFAFGIIMPTNHQLLGQSARSAQRAECRGNSCLSVAGNSQRVAGRHTRGFRCQER